MEWTGREIEAGETPEECVCREILEESGLVIQNPHLHGLLLFTNFKGNDGDMMRRYEVTFHSYL